MGRRSVEECEAREGKGKSGSEEANSPGEVKTGRRATGGGLLYG